MFPFWLFRPHILSHDHSGSVFCENIFRFAIRLSYALIQMFHGSGIVQVSCQAIRKTKDTIPPVKRKTTKKSEILL